jgi:hypothetical protein
MNISLAASYFKLSVDHLNVIEDREAVGLGTHD